MYNEYSEVGWFSNPSAFNLYDENTFSRSTKFLISSTVVHVLFFASLILLGSLFDEILPPQTLEISFVDASASSAPSLAAPAVKIPQATVALNAPSHSGAKDSAAPKASDVVVQAQRKAHAKTKATQLASRKTLPTKTHAVPKTLDTSSVENLMNRPVVLKADAFKMKDLDETLNSVDKEESKKLNLAKAQIRAESQAALLAQQEQDDSLRRQLEGEKAQSAQRIAALKAQHQAELQAARSAEEQRAAQEAAQEAEAAAAERAANENLRQQIEAQALEAERAEAEAHAGAAADREAAAKAAAREAEAREAALSAKAAASDSRGDGTGGVNGPVRDVSELRAIPGNKRPEYDSSDRLAGRQGQVDFLAYVGKDGRVSKFKLIKSTGHRSLDAKTYAAIKTWRFFPGQEGWVEIPFRWDLKGGPQEMPATLRRKISQR
jgi:TonB family protein